MTFRRAAPAALIVTIVAVVSAMTLLSNRLFAGLTRSVEAGQFALMRSSIESSLRDAELRAVSRAEIVAQMPAVRAAFAARDRERLLAEVREMYQAQHARYGVDQMAFHVPPSTVFVRAQNPRLFGDDLRRLRPMVAVANATRAAQRGIAMSLSTGPGFFGVVPVRDMQGEHLGTFEVGTDVGPELDGLKAKFALEITLFVDERMLRELSTGLGGDVLNAQNRVGRYLKFHSTNWALMQRLVDAPRLAHVNAATEFTRAASGRTYGVVLLPVRTATGTPIGVLAAARDFSGTREEAGRSLVWQLLLAVFAVVILAATVLVVLRGFLLQPVAMISSRLAALAAGSKAPPLDDASVYCDEVRSLAASYESLRVSAGHPPAAPKSDDDDEDAS